MPIIEPMSEERARQVVSDTRRAIRAHMAGDRHSPDARAMVLTAETHQLRSAAERRLRPVVTAEERDWRAAFRNYVAQGATVAEAAALANEATGRPVRA